MNKDPIYKDVKMSNEEITQVLNLLFEKQQDDEKYTLAQWVDIIGGLPKHLYEVLNQSK